jgi:hypothetical protein
VNAGQLAALAESFDQTAAELRDRYHAEGAAEEVAMCAARLRDLLGEDPGQPVMAKDVVIEKFHRARCTRPGCRWRGDEHVSYLGANGQREAHLDDHRRRRNPLLNGSAS